MYTLLDIHLTEPEIGDHLCADIQGVYFVSSHRLWYNLIDQSTLALHPRYYISLFANIL